MPIAGAVMSLCVVDVGSLQWLKCGKSQKSVAGS
jgi:hypothetical protein